MTRRNLTSTFFFPIFTDSLLFEEALTVFPSFFFLFRLTGVDCGDTNVEASGE